MSRREDLLVTKTFAQFLGISLSDEDENAPAKATLYTYGASRYAVQREILDERSKLRMRLRKLRSTADGPELGAESLKGLPRAVIRAKTAYRESWKTSAAASAAYGRVDRRIQAHFGEEAITYKDMEDRYTVNCEKQRSGFKRVVPPLPNSK